jgi:3-oxoacyl-[acyl-carrier protein] reductase
MKADDAAGSGGINTASTETPSMTSSLRGRIALVTGASRRVGIGAAICRELAAAGADVFFTHWGRYDQEMNSVDPDGPDALLAELRGLGVRTAAAAVDLSDPAAPEALLDEVERQLGLPTILVNNAAHSTRDGWRNLDAATLDAHYAVNLRATALLSVGLARRLADRPGGSPGGRIVNLSSGQGRGPMPEELAYVASKGAIEALTVTLAAELGPFRITVNAVDPGPTDTGWMSDDLKADLLSRFPLGRIGQAVDAARLIAFLASDAGGWITGEVIHSTGGFR